MSDDSFCDIILSPMLIGKEDTAFDDPDYIYELKLDGVRALAYLDTSTQLRNKRNINHNAKFPELQNLHTMVNTRCILDGELFVYHDDTIDFYEIQRRTLMSDHFKIKLAAKQYPASFTAFDILYYKDHFVVDEPLLKRKQLLEKVVKKENERFAIARYIDTIGTSLYELTTAKQLEGIVAKRKDSRYTFGKRTKDWIKCKHLIEDDYVLCGYIEKQNGILSFVLGQYDENKLRFMGHVTMGASLRFFKDYTVMKSICPFDEIPPNHEDAIWLTPTLVAIVTCMMKTESGSLRQPVLKAIRDDKDPKECLYKNNMQD